MQRLEVVNRLQLIISLPSDENGIKEFNRAFAEVQATLVKRSINDLNIDTDTKKRVVNNLLATLKEQVNERNDVDE